MVISHCEYVAICEFFKVHFKSLGSRTCERYDEKSGWRFEMDLRFKCALCNSDFVVSTETYRRFNIQSIPIKCPTCKDVGKAKASDTPMVGTVVDRRCIGFWSCVIVGHEIYDRLEAAPTRRGTVGRGVFCGRDFGEVVWHGRLDIWDHRAGGSPYPDEWASVRLMIAEKIIGVTGRGTAVWSATSELAPEIVQHRTESYLSRAW